MAPYAGLCGGRVQADGLKNATGTLGQMLVQHSKAPVGSGHDVQRIRPLFFS